MFKKYTHIQNYVKESTQHKISATGAVKLNTKEQLLRSNTVRQK